MVLTLMTRKNTTTNAKPDLKSSTSIGVIDIIPSAAKKASAANDSQGNRFWSAQFEKRWLLVFGIVLFAVPISFGSSKS